MILIRHLASGRERRPPAAVAVGNFDGLHLGHQALLELAVARAPQLRPTLLCFEPLPRTLFRPDQPVPRVMKLRDRLRVAAALRIEAVAQLRFDARFAAQSPETFVQRVLVEGLNARHVVAGEDFRFGRGAAGDIALLGRLGEAFGFTVDVVGEVVDAEGRISSTRLRSALAEGDLAQAERLLGRRYSISGRVIHGNRLGRTLGFPTANLRVAEPPALRGILAARVHGAGLAGHPAVASLGRRPTVAGRGWLLEVHLFDFSGSLYGSHLEVEFVGFIRHERHFDSLEAMTEQMHRDAAAARALLGGDGT